jgi:ElaB/YqjD/DUF883 family membrane-anchored ribosome-binding protein
VSRAKGSSACATLAYISAEKVREDRTGELYNFGRSERVIDVQTILPENAPEEYQDPKKLFNAIEHFETASNARTAKKIMVALPKEFDLELQKKVIENYIKENITSENYACTYAIHTDRENKNPHAHILIANRQLNSKGEWSTKSRKEYALDENGERIPQIDKATGEQKMGKRNEKLWKRVSVQVNPLDKKETLKQLRESWAAECNKHLEPAQQIDHRSYADQGREEEPTIHEGAAARKIEKKGGISERCQVNREIKQRNKLLQQIKAELENVAEKISTLVKEKGASINDRIGELLKRREASKAGRGTTERERTATERTASYSSADPGDTPTGTRDYTAELIAHRREAAEREIARISKEREEAARRKHEAEARKQQLTAEREKAAGADRSRDDYTLAR